MTTEVGGDATARLAVRVGDRDHVRGPATAVVTLVEYGDYECPYCRAAVSIVDELQRVLPDELRFVFRHFPLENLHPHARHAAEAAEAAGAQGRFFEMHAALFEHQTALKDADLRRYATDLELDTARFGAELDAHTHASRVRDDVRGGLRSGVRGTPTFYLDDVRYDGAHRRQPARRGDPGAASRHRRRRARGDAPAAHHPTRGARTVPPSTDVRLRPCVHPPEARVRPPQACALAGSSYSDAKR